MVDKYIKGYISFLKLEKGLSANTIEAYVRDLKTFSTYLNTIAMVNGFENINATFFSSFYAWLTEAGLGANSQARLVSGIKAFFEYLKLEDIIKNSPTDWIDSPRLIKKLPVVLDVHEIDEIIAKIDLSKTDGHRNRAMITTLYSSGLRVTELVNLKINNINFEDQILRVIGKGNKERLVPFGKEATKWLQLYLEERKHLDIAPAFANFVFLNRLKRPLTRVMVFMIIKSLAKAAGITKTVSPHTFRHSFATHLYEAGADLMAIRDMLGHVSITTTEIYTFISTSYLREQVLQFHPRS